MKHSENEIEEPVDFIDRFGICLAFEKAIGQKSGRFY